MATGKLNIPKEYRHWANRFRQNYLGARDSFEADAARSAKALEYESNEAISLLPYTRAALLAIAQQNPEQSVRMFECMAAAVDKTIGQMLETFEKTLCPEGAA